MFSCGGFTLLHLSNAVRQLSANGINALLPAADDGGVVVGLHFTVIDYIKCVHEQRTNTHMRVFAHELLRVRVNARGNPCLRRGLFHVCTCIECRLWIALIKQSLDPAERELSTGFGYKTCTLVYMYVCLLPRVDELHGIA